MTKPERDHDALVERTRSRPIPAGQVRVPQAAIFLVVQALIDWRAGAIQRARVVTGIGVAAHRRGLSVHEADHLVAADRARTGVLGGCADGIRRELGGSMRRRCCSMRLDRLVIGYDTIYAHQTPRTTPLI